MNRLATVSRLPTLKLGRPSRLPTLRLGRTPYLARLLALFGR